MNDLHGQEVAREILEQVRTRAVVNKAIGILQVWQACDRRQATNDIHDPQGSRGLHGEATRMIAIVDATADGTTDPDTGWS